MTARVVCIGIATLDAIVVVDRLPGSDERVLASDGLLAGGGIAATAAVALARLGVDVAFIGRVADDDAGRLIRDGLATEGVDVGGLRLDADRSPVSAILVEVGTGKRSIVPYLVPAPIRVDADDLAGADWVHVDELGLAALPDRIDARLSFDDGIGGHLLPFERADLYAPTAAVLARRFPASTLEASAGACLAAGPRLVVTTLGADGCLVSQPGRHERIPAWPADVVSTLGAGDVFHGALLASLVDGHSPIQAARRASAAAAVSCGALDGRSAIPNRSQLDAWITTREAARV